MRLVAPCKNTQRCMLCKIFSSISALSKSVFPIISLGDKYLLKFTSSSVRNGFQKLHSQKRDIWMFWFLSIIGFIIFEHVLCLALVSFLLVLNMYLPSGVVPRRTTYIQQSAYHLKETPSTTLRCKSKTVVKKEILIDHSLSCICMDL